VLLVVALGCALLLDAAVAVAAGSGSGSGSGALIRWCSACRAKTIE
jgi:cation transport ATPase